MADLEEAREFTSLKVTAKVVGCYRGADSYNVQREIGEQVGHSMSKILKAEDVERMFDELSALWRKYGVGSLTLLHAEPLTFTAEESDALREDGRICRFKEGLFKALLEDRVGLSCDVREMECGWKGDKTCKFSVSKLST